VKINKGKVTEKTTCEYALNKNGKPFHRIFHIELTPKQLLDLAFNLSKYLSKPLINQGRNSNIDFKTEIA